MSDLTASKTVATFRLLNGQLVIDLPNDPRELTGPTHFTLALTHEQTEAAIAGVPEQARERIRLLAADHVNDVQSLAGQAESEFNEINSRFSDAQRTQAAIDSTRGLP